MNVQVCDVACLFFLLYANLLVLVTLCEGNHYPFIEERYKINVTVLYFYTEKKSKERIALSITWSIL